MISGDAPNGATGSYDGGTAGGSANALTATVSGLGSSPSTGNVVILKTSAANTGAATLAINSGSAIAIKNQDGTTALAGGEMASAKYYLLEYNGTNWVLLNPVVSATDTAVCCHAYKNASQSISFQTYTDVTFDSEYIDTNSIHSTSSNTNRFVAPSAGKYLFMTSIETNFTGYCRSYHALNGTRDDGSQTYVPGNWTTAHYHSVVTMAANDYLSLQVYLEANGGAYGTTDGRPTRAMLIRIGD